MKTIGVDQVIYQQDSNRHNVIPEKYKKRLFLKALPAEKQYKIMSDSTNYN
jgi:hypothetical protein